ncbi:hypothetical protein EDC04DRAFT_2603072 [Pisolithus marmoratus]|nr:hypothetical protein EDC04DRAFT_2603072 [Pisolithus marmoratus]
MRFTLLTLFVAPFITAVVGAAVGSNNVGLDGLEKRDVCGRAGGTCTMFTSDLVCCSGLSCIKYDWSPEVGYCGFGIGGSEQVTQQQYPSGKLPKVKNMHYIRTNNAERDVPPNLFTKSSWTIEVADWHLPTMASEPSPLLSLGGVLPVYELTETVYSSMRRGTSDNGEERCDEESKQSKTHSEVVQKDTDFVDIGHCHEPSYTSRVVASLGGLFGGCFNGLLSVDNATQVPVLTKDIPGQRSWGYNTQKDWRVRFRVYQHHIRGENAAFSGSFMHK